MSVRRLSWDDALAPAVAAEVAAVCALSLPRVPEAREGGWAGVNFSLENSVNFGEATASRRAGLQRFPGGFAAWHNQVVEKLKIHYVM